MEFEHHHYNCHQIKTKMFALFGVMCQLTVFWKIFNNNVSKIIVGKGYLLDSKHTEKDFAKAFF